MSDYSFMKSGFNNLVTQQDENFEQKFPDIKENNRKYIVFLIKYLKLAE